jgi:hypothetical protein
MDYDEQQVTNELENAHLGLSVGHAFSVGTVEQSPEYDEEESNCREQPEGRIAWNAISHLV